MGAAFLMATSAIGPGFITQTTVFTAAQGASFGFVILLSILIDIIVQLNIWRAVAAAGMKAPALVNRVLPGAGYLLGVLVFCGGLVFNVGNVAGCGLGLQTMSGLHPVQGAVASGMVAMIIFLVKEFGRVMDAFARWLGLLMIGMVLWVAVNTAPPVPLMLKEAVWPSSVNILSVLTLVGGTVGGYISFAGAHRMLDASASAGPDLQQVNRSAVSGIVISGIMRILLFAAALGVVTTGFVPDPSNPAASIFRAALGLSGEKIFGFILWCAAITSVSGASYTSVSFLESWHPIFLRYRQACIVAFIALSTGVFAFFGQPVKILVAAGAINGLILPFALCLVLVALGNKTLMQGQAHPRWLRWGGWIVTALVAYMSWNSLAKLF